MAGSGRTRRRSWTSAAIAGLAVLTGCSSTASAGQQPGRDVPDRRDAAAAVTRGNWQRLPPSPTGARLGPVLAWDGDELLQVGGTTGQVKQADGATVDLPAGTDAVAFSPTGNRWRRLDPAPFPVSAQEAVTTWTGRQLIVLTSGGAAALTPSTGHWHAVAAPPISDLRSAAAVWSGDRMVVAATPRTPGGDAITQVAGYDPDTDRWVRADPPVTPGHDQRGAPVVATPDGVVLFSLWSHSVRQVSQGGTMISVQAGVDVLRLTHDTIWSALGPDWPQRETVSSPLLTDVGIIVPAGQIWCGDCSHPAPVGEHGYLADPRTLRGRAMPHGPLDDTDPQAVWTGRALITLAQAEIGTSAGTVISSGDLAVWDPATDNWTRAARPPSGLDYRTAPVWGAHRLLAIDAYGTPFAFVPAVG